MSDSGWHANTVTNAYLQAVMQWSGGVNNVGQNPVPFAGYTELGTGSGTPAVTDKSLFAPVSATFQSCLAISLLTSPANTEQWISVYTANPGTYTEVGLLTADGALYAHLMTSVTISSGNQTSITWQITAGAG